MEMNALLRKAIFEGDKPNVIEAISSGADIHMDGEYALRTAVYQQNIEIVDYLLKQGASARVIEDISHILAKGNIDLVNLLIKNGARFDSGKLIDFFLLIHMTDLIPVKFLSEMSNFDREFMEKTLKNACTSGKIKTVEFLVQSGANVRYDNDAPLLEASKNKHSDIAIYLIEHGANPLVLMMKDDLEVAAYLFDKKIITTDIGSNTNNINLTPIGAMK